MATLKSEAEVERYQRKLDEGQAAVAAGDWDLAVKAYRAAASEKPRDPLPLAYLADTYRKAGNEPAAELSFRTAEELASTSDDRTRARLAALYRDAGSTALAIKVYQRLAAEQKLTRDERLDLARLQARDGDAAGAYASLEPLQLADPDDPEAKIIEAEALLVDGKEVKAAEIMDRVIAAQPRLAEARVLRARYFLGNGYPDLALQDVAALQGADAERVDVVSLEAKSYLSQQKFDEAEKRLTGLLSRRPSDPEYLAQLAEVKWAQGRLEQADDLVAQALAQKPRHPRATYVRARIREDAGDLDEALQSYRLVTRLSPSFADAYSRIWRICEVQRDGEGALSALETLHRLKEASLEERVKLAELSARYKRQVPRALGLIDEALAKDPQNARYREIRAKLLKARPAKRPPMVIQMK